jgi:GTP-binding protein
MKHDKIFSKPCTFEVGATKISQIPATDLSEVAFVGKSNVGKSSLINCLVNQKSLARTSRNPGCTRQINFFKLADFFYLVDLPGYGYAKVDNKTKNDWNRLIIDYLRGRALLKRVFILIDARRGIKEHDEKTMKFLDDFATVYQIVFTKIDKLKEKEIEGLDEEFQTKTSRFVACHPVCIKVSSVSKAGIEDLREEIVELIG